MPGKRKNSEGNDLNNKRSQFLPQMSRISRSISACQRCRVKKIKCDQNFPKCTKCDKADVDCVGLDSVTGREVPRSYVMYLENRIMQLEEKISRGGICPKDNTEVAEEAEPQHGDGSITNYTGYSQLGVLPQQIPFENIDASIFEDSGISFSKLMFTAIRSHKGGKEQDKINPVMNFENNSALPAILPPKSTAQEFLKIFFSQSNSQLPIFHREEFIQKYFIPIYGKIDQDVILANNYTSINVSFFQAAENFRDEDTWFFQYKQEFQKRLQNTNCAVDPNEISNAILPPKKFHKALYFLSMVFAISCSVHHLQYHSNISNSFKIAANRYFETTSSSEDKLESLQSILLLTLYSLMRPTVPGVWYVLGLALRVCVDLGLHKETSIQNSNSIDYFTQDKRRRLFWCTYALDRQICFYLGRPVGIPEESIGTPFPSALDDSLIDNNNNSKNPPLLKNDSPTYKSVSLAFIEMRRIQGEVQKVLYEDSDIPRNFPDLLEWKLNIIEKLKNWKLHLPKTERDMNCDFNVEFFNLNYNHTVLMIHGLSPKNNKLSVSDFIRLQDSSKEIIHCYNQLHSSKCINYTWVTVHNLFLAGTCYLYAIYSSDDVCKQNSLHEVKIVSRECINVLNSLIDKCAAAYNCRHSFEVLTAAVVKLRYNEVMHGVDSYIPTAQQIAKNQPVGYVNSNLENLVQNLESRADSGDNSKFIEKHTQMDKVDNFFHFASNVSTKEDEVNNENDTILQSPPTFEWISIDKSSRPSNNNLDIQNSGNHLNNFFDNLGKLPSLPTETDDHSDDNNMIGNFDADQNHHSIQADTNNHKAQATVKLSESQYRGSSHPHEPNDGKKQFELPDAPVDSIWDQFLTSVTPAFGLNSSLFMLQDNSENHDKY